MVMLNVIILQDLSSLAGFYFLALALNIISKLIRKVMRCFDFGDNTRCFLGLTCWLYL